MSNLITGGILNTKIQPDNAPGNTIYKQINIPSSTKNKQVIFDPKPNPGYDLTKMMLAALLDDIILAISTTVFVPASDQSGLAAVTTFKTNLIANLQAKSAEIKGL